ncbi:MAG TPA: Rv3235 family protein [Nocardioidaceae bacterium]|nr:Rv3235 family protein [Nocardioidaceae bacterium]
MSSRPDDLDAPVRAVRPPAPFKPQYPPAPAPWATRLGTDPGQVPMASVQGTLALDLGPRLAAAPLQAAPDLRLLSACPDGAAETEPGLRAWAARFAQAVVEVCGGDRPASQLVRLTSGRVYEDLTRRVRILATTAPAGRRMASVRPQVQSLRVFQPSPHSAEVSVHVRHGPRSRALAARLERYDGRWMCTCLELG